MSFRREMLDFLDAYEQGTRIRLGREQAHKIHSEIRDKANDKNIRDTPGIITPGSGGGGVGTTTAPTEGGGGSTGDSGVTMPNAGGRSVLQNAYNYYRQRGLGHIPAASIVGNFGQESGGDPRVISGVRRGDNGNSAYIAQWQGPRLTNLMKFTAERGRQQPTLQDQLDFALEEVNPNSPYVDQRAAAGWQSVLNAKSIDEGVRAWAQHFERPANLDKDFGGRLKYAQSLGDEGGYGDRQFSWGKTAAPAPSGGIPEPEEQAAASDSYGMSGSEEDPYGDLGDGPEISSPDAPEQQYYTPPQVEDEFYQGGAIPDDTQYFQFGGMPVDQTSVAESKPSPSWDATKTAGFGGGGGGWGGGNIFNRNFGAPQANTGGGGGGWGQVAAGVGGSLFNRNTAPVTPTARAGPIAPGVGAPVSYPAPAASFSQEERDYINARNAQTGATQIDPGNRFAVAQQQAAANIRPAPTPAAPVKPLTFEQQISKEAGRDYTQRIPTQVTGPKFQSQEYDNRIAGAKAGETEAQTTARLEKEKAEADKKAAADKAAADKKAAEDKAKADAAAKAKADAAKKAAADKAKAAADKKRNQYVPHGHNWEEGGLIPEMQDVEEDTFNFRKGGAIPDDDARFKDLLRQEKGDRDRAAKRFNAGKGGPTSSAYSPKKTKSSQKVAKRSKPTGRNAAKRSGKRRQYEPTPKNGPLPASRPGGAGSSTNPLQAAVDAAPNRREAYPYPASPGGRGGPPIPTPRPADRFEDPRSFDRSGGPSYPYGGDSSLHPQRPQGGGAPTQERPNPRAVQRPPRQDAPVLGSEQIPFRHSQGHPPGGLGTSTVMPQGRPNPRAPYEGVPPANPGQRPNPRTALEGGVPANPGQRPTPGAPAFHRQRVVDPDFGRIKVERLPDDPNYPYREDEYAPEPVDPERGAYHTDENGNIVYGYAKGGAIPDDREGPYPNWQAEEAGYTTSSADPRVVAATSARQPSQASAPTDDVPVGSGQLSTGHEPVDTTQLRQRAAPAIMAGLQKLQQIFGFGAPEQGVPTPESEAQQNQKAQAFARHEGAATKQEIQATDFALGLDQIPVDEGTKNLMRVERSVLYYLQNGDKDRAETAAAAYLLYGAGQMKNAAQMASIAFQDYQETGDPKSLKNASLAVQRAYSFIPDGANVQIDIDPKTRQIVATTTDENGRAQQHVIDPQAVPQLLQGAMSGSSYWQSMYSIGHPDLAKSEASARGRVPQATFEQKNAEWDRRHNIRRREAVADSAAKKKAAESWWFTQQEFMQKADAAKEGEKRVYDEGWFYEKENYIAEQKAQAEAEGRFEDAKEWDRREQNLETFRIRNEKRAAEHEDFINNREGLEEDARHKRDVGEGLTLEERDRNTENATFDNLNERLQAAKTPEEKKGLLNSGLDWRYRHTADRQEFVPDENLIFNPAGSRFKDDMFGGDINGVRSIARSLAAKNRTLGGDSAMELAGQMVTEGFDITTDGHVMVNGQPLVFNPALLPMTGQLMSRYMRQPEAAE